MGVIDKLKAMVSGRGNPVEKDAEMESRRERRNNAEIEHETIRRSEEKIEAQRTLPEARRRLAEKIKEQTSPFRQTERRGGVVTEYGTVAPTQKESKALDKARETWRKQILQRQFENKSKFVREMKVNPTTGESARKEYQIVAARQRAQRFGQTVFGMKETRGAPKKGRGRPAGSMNKKNLAARIRYMKQMQQLRELRAIQQGSGYATPNYPPQVERPRTILNQQSGFFAQPQQQGYEQQRYSQPQPQQQNILSQPNSFFRQPAPQPIRQMPVRNIKGKKKYYPQQRNSGSILSTGSGGFI